MIIVIINNNNNFNESYFRTDFHYLFKIGCLALHVLQSNLDQLKIHTF